MTGFLKMLLMLLLIGAAAFVASVDAGRVTITWFDVRIETTGIVLVLAVALVCFISMGFMRMMLALAGIPMHVQHWREKREWQKKETAREAEKALAVKAEVVAAQVVKKPKLRGKK